MSFMVFHVYTVSPFQGRKLTVAFVKTEDEAKELCDGHILYNYEFRHRKTKKYVNEELLKSITGS